LFRDRQTDQKRGLFCKNILDITSKSKKSWYDLFLHGLIIPLIGYQGKLIVLLN
jgi:hypothetical protein